MRPHRSLIFFFLSIIAIAKIAASDTEKLDVLLIGNYYTYAYEIFHLLEDMAESEGNALEVSYTRKMPTLDRASRTDSIRETITGKSWDYVILQGRPSSVLDSDRLESLFTPGVEELSRLTKNAGAEPILMAMYAEEEGAQLPCCPDYVSTQIYMNEQYRAVGNKLGVYVLPVGSVWNAVVDAGIDRKLWHKKDGRYASFTGTYLIACTIYTYLYNKSIVGMEFTAGVPAEAALVIQELAADVVLANN